MKTLPSLLPAVALAGLCLALAGCGDIIPPPQADSTRFYVLAGAGAPQPPSTITSPAGKLRVGLRTVELSAYLRTRSMIVRRGSNELSVDEYHRWGEPLADAITRSLRAGLLSSPSVGSAAVEPFPLDTDLDYTICVTVTRCEGVSAGGRTYAAFAALIEVNTGGPSPHLVIRKAFTAPEVPWDGDDYGKLAAALGEDVNRLGGEIVASLPSHP
jgi:uncharacterized protein